MGFIIQVYLRMKYERRLLVSVSQGRISSISDSVILSEQLSPICGWFAVFVQHDIRHGLADRMNISSSNRIDGIVDFASLVVTKSLFDVTRTDGAGGAVCISTICAPGAPVETGIFHDRTP
jgi:hypothetical protein